MVDVPDCAHVDMWFGPLKHFLCHFFFLPIRLSSAHNQI
jgi:hypothetical protein